ncbi:MAG: endonuclease/exonuclease/phosphatase family protein [Gammaproteobacteria bacterium]|nr:endonuclease/exonuclease/phosphatase family protein [Gammaproteobacteria bacterium]
MNVSASASSPPRASGAAKLAKRILACVIAWSLCALPSADDASADELRSVAGSGECSRLLAEPKPMVQKALDGSAIRILSWNVKKGQDTDWARDLEALAGNKDLILIQEATRAMGQGRLPEHTGFWSFAEGYRTRRMVSGVATASRAQPLSRCRLTATEPWLRSPKATMITEFALRDTRRTLLVVNTHMVNFSVGNGAFGAQLRAIEAVLEAHPGPAVLSGDFNTWRAARRELLSELAGRLRMQPVRFETDYRSRFFGAAVDHVYVSGLKIVDAQTHRVGSSDHNPLTVTVSLH